jgi:hypothetical protein
MRRNFFDYRLWAFPLVVAVSSASLLFVSVNNFLLFHSITEIFSTVIAFGIFVIAWSSRRYIDNIFLLILGIGYLFVGGLGLIHTLSYKGIEVIEVHGANLATQLWIAARYLETFTFLAALIFVKKSGKNQLKENGRRAYFIFLIYSVVTVAVTFSIFSGLFPDAYIESSGLTPFKIGSEYLISLLLLVVLIILVKKRSLFEPEMAEKMSLALVMKIISELFFTEYAGVFDFSNIMGHVFNFISFMLLYRSVLEAGLMRPYETLFRTFKQNEERLREKIEEQLAESYQHLGLINRKISILLEIESHANGQNDHK